MEIQPVEHQPAPADANAPGPDDCFTNFTGISYEKMRNSYDQCEVAAPPDTPASSELAEKKRIFLIAYQLGLTVEQAAQLAGVTPRAAYYWRDKDPDFALAWQNSRDRFVEALEMLAFQRAAKGSDRMLTFLLKSHRPDIYNERVRAHNAKSRSDKPFTFADLAEKFRRYDEEEKGRQVSP